MKKHTSKSASEIQKTSSPSGTSNLTEGTANKPKRRKRHNRFDRVVEHVRNMTSAEFRESLQATGIIDADGNLTKKYMRR